MDDNTDWNRRIVLGGSVVVGSPRSVSAGSTLAKDITSHDRAMVVLYIGPELRSRHAHPVVTRVVNLLRRS